MLNLFVLDFVLQAYEIYRFVDGVASLWVTLLSAQLDFCI